MRQMPRFTCGLIVLTTLTAFADTTSYPDEKLSALIAEHWEYYLREDPIAATQVGVNDFNDRLPRVAAGDRRRRLETERAFLRRARDLDRSVLSDQGRIDLELFEWVLRDSIGSYELELARIPFNTFSGFFMSALTASDGVRMQTAKDYEDYVARLRDIPRFFAENVDNMRVGSRQGFVLPKIVIQGVLPTLEAQVKENPEDSRFYDPFESLSGRLDDDEKNRLRRQAKAAIHDAVMPAFAAVVDFLSSEYAASDSLAATALPDGRRYYAYQIRRYTTLEGAMADDIHATGLDEVRRIRDEMEGIIEELGFDGGFQEFTDYLRTEPRFYAVSEEALLKEVAYIAKRIDYVMPGFFNRLARQPYGIVPVPAEIAPNYVTGAYYSAPLGGSNGGQFWVNTYALDQRPLYEMPALTLHEAVPGHHHQNALALEMQDVPDFRRNLYFSAFGEGWALYAEWLGQEMGIYRSPYERFGRLSYEMWRACRLVIDTGIHSKGWSREQAMQFLADNTSLSPGNVRAEVDRYISWPGQALAYKLGELEIRKLRRDAERELGQAFDLREFHDVILANGAVPLAMLERVTWRYIADKQSAEGR